MNLVEELGADAYVYGELTGDPEVYEKQYIVRFDGRVPPRISDVIHVEVRQGEEHVFNPDTGERLGGAPRTCSNAPRLARRRSNDSGQGSGRSDQPARGAGRSRPR